MKTHYLNCLFGLTALLLMNVAVSPGIAADPHGVSKYNVVWSTPSEDSAGSMPLGNGDVGLNAWVEPDGDLVFYIGKTDSWGDNGRLLKIGRVRITLDPAPPTGVGFRQCLQLDAATMVVQFGEASTRTQLKLWADANHGVIHVTVTSAKPTKATARIELWRTARQELKELEVSDVLLNRARADRRQAAVFVEPDTVIDELDDSVGWYHHNTKSVGPTITAKVQGLTGFKRADPLLHRTFGAIISAANGRRVDRVTLASAASVSHRFNIFVLTAHPATPRQWMGAVTRLQRAVEAVPFALRRSRHEAWWHAFWKRSWIDVETRAKSTPRSLIPANRHPVRVGIDQNGQNRFRGDIGRTSLLDRAVDARTVEQLTRLKHDAELPDAAALRLPATTRIVTPRAYQDPAVLGNSAQWTFPLGLTIESWVRPDQMPGGGGRIVDKVTPGGSDGLLLDTYPGNSLRLIVGNEQVKVKDALPAGKWTHVVAVVDNVQDRLELYVNGKSVDRRQGLGGSDAAVVSQMYALQRFIDACAGRGQFPIKFNGSIFTVPYPDRPGDADYRRWGPGYWWQNTRLPYVSMCTSGDFEMMRPLFRMYADQLMPLNKYRTRLYLGHDGVFIPECIYFWGDMFSETYGWTPFEQRDDKLQQNRYHKWEWVSGPELVWMMYDYYEHTEDAKFLKGLLLPTAHEVLTFFDQHYKTGTDGKLVMYPSQAAETWWDCTNPMPEIAGLHAVIQRLMSLPDSVTTTEQRELWTGLKRKLPDLPIREINGHPALAPAERFEMKRNIENPELYAVFPFRLVSFEKENVDLGRVALEHRLDRGNIGWRQDDVFMAYLALADDARQYLVGRARRHDPRSRFPAFWGPNYDWVPDQDHGSILMKTLQAMLIQTEGRKIFLFPAWPTDWNVRFKVHAPHRTVVEGEYRDGKVVQLKVTPETRRTDVVISGNAPQ